MPALNRIQLIGRLGKEPETRFTPKGSKVTNFSLAVDHRWKDAKGEMKKSTDWFNLEAWGRVGEVCQQYLKKGQMIYVEGRVKTERYEHEGEARYFTKVVVGQMQMLEFRGEEEPAVLVDEEIPTED
jgi:single-strand DNA-binding protein